MTRALQDGERSTRRPPAMPCRAMRPWSVQAPPACFRRSERLQQSLRLVAIVPAPLSEMGRGKWAGHRRAVFESARTVGIWMTFAVRQLGRKALAIADRFKVKARNSIWNVFALQSRVTHGHSIVAKSQSTNRALNHRRDGSLTVMRVPQPEQALRLDSVLLWNRTRRRAIDSLTPRLSCGPDGDLSGTRCNKLGTVGRRPARTDPGNPRYSRLEVRPSGHYCSPSLAHTRSRRMPSDQNRFFCHVWIQTFLELGMHSVVEEPVTAARVHS